MLQNTTRQQKQSIYCTGASRKEDNENDSGIFATEIPKKVVKKDENGIALMKVIQGYDSDTSKSGWWFQN